MDVRVKRVSWSVLANREVCVSPERLEWPRNFGSIQYTPDTLLFPGWKYLVFQLWLIRSYVDEGVHVNFPEYEECVASIEKWGKDSLWTLPELVKQVLYSLLDEQLPYQADWQRHGIATNITLHNNLASASKLTLVKKIEALEDNQEGFQLLRLYRQRNVRPVFERLMMAEPMVMLSCRKLAFKNELDAILHQQMVIVDEQETAT